METCTVSKTGSSATVVLPAAWRKRNRVSAGDELLVDTSIEGRITFEKPRPDTRPTAAQAHFDLVESLPQVPWTRGDSPDDDKALIASRYE